MKKGKLSPFPEIRQAQIWWVYSDLSRLWWWLRFKQKVAARSCPGTRLGLGITARSDPCLPLSTNVPHDCPSSVLLPPQNVYLLPLPDLFPQPSDLHISWFGQVWKSLTSCCGGWIQPLQASIPPCTNLACFWEGTDVLYSLFTTFLGQHSFRIALWSYNAVHF